MEFREYFLKILIYMQIFSLELCNGIVFLALHEDLQVRPHIFYICTVPSSL